MVVATPRPVLPCSNGADAEDVVEKLWPFGFLSREGRYRHVARFVGGGWGEGRSVSSWIEKEQAEKEGMVVRLRREVKGTEFLGVLADWRTMPSPEGIVLSGSTL